MEEYDKSYSALKYRIAAGLGSDRSQTDTVHDVLCALSQDDLELLRVRIDGERRKKATQSFPKLWVALWIATQSFPKEDQAVVTRVLEALEDSQLRALLGGR